MAEKQSTQNGLSGPGSMLGYSIAGKIFAIMLMAWIINTSYFAFAFFVAAMIPSIAAMLFDRSRGRFATKTISACNMIGVLPYLFEIYIRYEPTLAAKEVMYDLSSWVFVYGFAMVGWLLVWLIPQFTIILYAARAESRAEHLSQRQDNIIKEWGDDVTAGHKLKTTASAQEPQN